MGDCRHKNAEHLRRGDISPHGYNLPAFLAMNEQFRCLDCGAWLSLGPSNDSPEAVRIEMRAAHLAHGTLNEFTDCEWMGLEGDETYSSGVFFHSIDKLPTRNLRQYLAGFLAYQITHHDNEAA